MDAQDKLIALCSAWLGDDNGKPVLINENYGKLYRSPRGRYYVTNMVSGYEVNLHYAENICMRDNYVSFTANGEAFELNFIRFVSLEDILKGA